MSRYILAYSLQEAAASPSIVLPRIQLIGSVIILAANYILQWCQHFCIER